jgi:AbrB family looped-hinge helix DNA binding protein
MQKKSTDVILRPKRQITLPKEVCNQLDIEAGDMLELVVEESVLIARPKKAVSLEALREIRDAFQRSGISEAELQTAGRKVREDLAGKRYGFKR